jgi:type I restriction enzyme S subunit
MKNAPKLRFKDENGRDFPAWEKKKLGDICSRIMDGTHFSPKSKEGSKKYITSKNIRNEGLDLSNIKYISDDDHKDIYKKCPVKFGDVLLTKDGENTGNCCLNTLHEEFSLLSSVAVINGLPSILSNIFLLQVLKSKKGIGSITGAMAGQAITRITLEKIKNFIFDFPSYPEQTKIANFLTAIDDRITQLTQKVDGLQQYKKAVMQQIFSQKLRFKDEKGRAFGAWEEKRLGDVTSKVSKKNKDNISYPIYSISNKNGFVPQSEQFDGVDSNDRNYDISLYKIVQKNTFAYNPARINVGSIGYSGELNNVIISSLYVCFKTSESISDKYMLQYLDSFEFRKGVLRSVEGGVREYLFYENFSSIKHTFPSLKEQEKIAGFLGAVDEKLAQAKAKLDAVKQYKQGLLQQMFV